MHEGFVLHRWDFQESSIIIDVFTRLQGRVRIVAKGAKRNNSPWRAILQPFIPLLLDWRGRGDLKTLISAETQTGLATPALTGTALYSAFYLNELLTRLLPPQGEAEPLYEEYAKTLELLHHSSEVEPLLRHFEWRLLWHLGVAFDWQVDAATGEALGQSEFCYFVAGQGFFNAQQSSEKAIKLASKDVQQLAQFERLDSRLLKLLKHIMRAELAIHLGEKPLHSRQLFRS
ncbi:DNA repair protein RecO [Idiomarina tyrosinivorans]|uniref:DNA repair protein RecO n=1 Tax=Idiomarina tyrosinivorans TaxID=1445662 RepID=A0A432ZRR5_9GAMM|nr:DNA repair protein RecO [Idiomarina tyrosinivorans]RUO80597.1 DNA repair protein RecO [Idiomarina tyrosinivorans]